jgi:hypothetical protein
MRFYVMLLSLVIGTGSAFAADPNELVTAPDAILCLDADTLDTAVTPAVAKSQTVLRAMGCMRSGGGIRTRVMGQSPDGSWQVRFYPSGISGGVVLWGRPSSFIAPTARRGAGQPI